MTTARKKKNQKKCPFCPKDETVHKVDKENAGNHIGNSTVLGQRIMASFYNSKPLRAHPLSMPKAKGSGSQAHHLIYSHVMSDDKDWAKICTYFGYDINCKENGVILPSDMRIACKYHIPLHRGPHSATFTSAKVTYIRAVITKIQPIKDAALRKEFCNPENDIVKKLNNVSKYIWIRIKCFEWTLTSDGKDYIAGGKGCFGQLSIPKKRKKEEMKHLALVQKKLANVIAGQKFQDNSGHDTGHININVKGKYFKERQ